MGVVQLVECLIWDQVVAGSSPVTHTRKESNHGSLDLWKHSSIHRHYSDRYLGKNFQYTKKVLNTMQRIHSTPEILKELNRMDKAYAKMCAGLPNLDKDPLFLLLGLQTEVIIFLRKKMKQENLDIKGLAKVLKTTQKEVKRLLDEENQSITLLDICKIAVAFEKKPEIKFLDSIWTD